MFACIYEAASHMTYHHYTYPVYTCQDKARLGIVYRSHSTALQCAV